MEFNGEPVSNIVWVDVDSLEVNDYNPNTVLQQELKLLEFSIVKNGWIQPILISKEKIIIDGFHRALLSKKSKKLKGIYEGKVPCVVMDISQAERKLLTIRINRAKGEHSAFKMQKIIKSLSIEHGLTTKDICTSLGMSKAEFDLLMQKDVFEKLDTKNHKYGQAWATK